MSREKKRTTVKINGQPYTIVGQVDESHIEKVAEVVDNKMREIGKRHPTLDSKDLAVLAAVNVVSDYFLLQEQYNALLQSQKEED